MHIMQYFYINNDYNRCSRYFQQGIEHLNNGSIDLAAHSFELAYETVRSHDEYHNKYASFCGLLRIFRGDRGGLILCRDAVCSERHDADVYFNLARAEWYYKNRSKTVEVLFNGLKIDSQHPGLLRLQRELGIRQRNPLPLLDRNNPLNNLIGRLLRKARSSHRKNLH